MGESAQTAASESREPQDSREPQAPSGEPAAARASQRMSSPSQAAAVSDDPVPARAPLPPNRPVDLVGLTPLPAPPRIAKPKAVAASTIDPSAGLRLTVPSQAPAVLAALPPEEDREWPLNPNAATAVPDLNIESPDEPGTRFIATDPGISALCLPTVLKEIVQKVASRFGEVKITSTMREAGHNRRVGGRRDSYHLNCEAVDFRVSQASPRAVYAFVRDLPETGGHKIYWNGIIHVDVGPRRSW